MSWLFSAPAKAKILLDAPGRSTIPIDTRKTIKSVYVYAEDESINGKVVVTVGRGRELEHMGIRIDLIGQLELYNDRSNQQTFMTVSKQIAPPGRLITNETFNFSFTDCEKKMETYIGIYARVKYFIKLVIIRNFGSNITDEEEVAIIKYGTPPQKITPIKMEIGIEQCLHIEVNYSKNHLHLEDVILGRISFIVVRIRIHSMEIALQRCETIGTGLNTTNHAETIAKFEVMDGIPVKDESIAVRMFLGAYNIMTPSSVSEKLSVKYSLNILLLDDEGRRYFKQHEIKLWRKRPDQQDEIPPYITYELPPNHRRSRIKKINPVDRMSKGDAVEGKYIDGPNHDIDQTPTNEEGPLERSEDNLNSKEVEDDEDTTSNLIDSSQLKE